MWGTVSDSSPGGHNAINVGIYISADNTALHQFSDPDNAAAMNLDAGQWGHCKYSFDPRRQLYM